MPFSRFTPCPPVKYTLPFTRQKFAVESTRAHDSQTLGRSQRVATAFLLWWTRRHSNHHPSQEQDPISGTGRASHKYITICSGIFRQKCSIDTKFMDIYCKYKIIIGRIKQQLELYEYNVGHCPVSEYIWYTRRFEKCLYSSLQVIACHCTD